MLINKSELSTRSSFHPPVFLSHQYGLGKLSTGQVFIWPIDQRKYLMLYSSKLPATVGQKLIYKNSLFAHKENCFLMSYLRENRLSRESKVSSISRNIN